MIHGLLLLDKPTGLTSHDVVNRVRRILNQRAVGHNGTLDPLASGLMVILLGEATKLSDYFLSGDKGYQVTALFGCETDTLDVTGTILSHTDARIPKQSLQGWLDELKGEHLWEVPAYSAVKVAGKKLYEYARKDEVIQAPQKKMKFWDIHLISHTEARATIALKCSKGSYIRSWVKALGQKAQCGAVVEELRRTYSEPFDVESTLTLPALEENANNSQNWGKAFVHLNNVRSDLTTVTVRGRDERLLGHGQIAYDLERRLIEQVRESHRTGQAVGVRVVSGIDGGLLALIEAIPGQGLKIKRVFKTTS